MVAVEVFEMVVKECENDVWFGFFKGNTELASGFFSTLTLGWRSRFGEANCTYNFVRILISMCWVGNLPGACERPIPATTLPMLARGYAQWAESFEKNVIECTTAEW